MSQKERKTLVVARVESTYGVDSILANLGNNPSPFATDALLCSAFDVKTNADLLERANYNPSLSNDASSVGRCLAQMTFTTELRASGVFGTPARIGRLFKGAGMAETIVSETAGASIANPTGLSVNASAAILAAVSGLTKTTRPTSRFDRYRITFTTAGAPGTAKYVVTGAGFPEGDSAVLPTLLHRASTSSALGTITVAGTAVAPTFTFAGTFAQYDVIELFVGGIRFAYQVTGLEADNDAISTAISTLVDADTRLVAASATQTISVTLAAGLEITTSASATQTVTLGSSGGVVTLPILSGTFVAGEGMEILLRRPGVRYDPVSDNFTSLTIWAFLDGTLYRMQGARGTFQGSGDAAKFPTLSWTFTGLYCDPSDAAFPTNVQYEESPVWKVELSELALDGLSTTLAKASKFSFDIANTVGPNDNINASEAFDFVDITARKPVAGADPETVLPSVFSPWARMRRGDTGKFGVTVGKRGGRGHQIRIQGDRASYTGAPLAARTGVRAYDYALALARISGNGDDEMHITFY